MSERSFRVDPVYVIREPLLLFLQFRKLVVRICRQIIEVRERTKNTGLSLKKELNQRKAKKLVCDGNVGRDVCVGSVTSSDSGHSTQLDSHSGSSVEAGGSPPPPQRRHSALQGT